ncbi:bifunctional helix-turn-helix transcriptional regulator/GNAT family N-acetyltransferase [uncultured Psychroserpens sp.]|uniref:bifunctional helix-turn-helix transcriptional regulator/GNAT family N-acetyltransferase n=1 Tax=uncultured Psychroserpens sp. TaxID=255436 RepID=UPI0026266DDA|nr:bifunctional helix-turn-helix transcriptional regulator/GNAT family N-acetyltransferase [uncultured Psychroserpens sp.]
MDALRGFSELALGSRLKRLSDFVMKEVQCTYDYFNIEFDPYLFPIIKIIDNKNGVTNVEIKTALKLSQPAISQAVNKLIAKELLHLESDTIDKRKKILTLSDKGKHLVARMKPLWAVIDNVIKEYTTHSSNSLTEHLNKLEDKLQHKSLSKTIINMAKMEVNNDFEIINYDERYAPNFYDLNIEWLKTYFYVETFDEEVLSKPEHYIINKGGYIFFAKRDDLILGTVALMPTHDPLVYELTKMAVLSNQRGQKIGQRLMQHCIDFAQANGFKALMLYSNTILENAIYIYKKYGFIELELEKDSPYERSNIKMELTL